MLTAGTCFIISKNRLLVKREFQKNAKKQKTTIQNGSAYAVVSVLALSVTFGDSSPFGRGGSERSELTERVRMLSGRNAP